jgi:hypothetical protein
MTLSPTVLLTEPPILITNGLVVSMPVAAIACVKRNLPKDLFSSSVVKMF